MTVSEFNALPYESQLTLIYNEGTLLACRWERIIEVTLYYLPGGPFVEAYVDVETEQLEQVYPFVHTAPLEAYAKLVQLPAEWTQ